MGMLNSMFLCRYILNQEIRTMYVINKYYVTFAKDIESKIYFSNTNVKRILCQIVRSNLLIILISLLVFDSVFY